MVDQNGRHAWPYGRQRLSPRPRPADEGSPRKRDTDLVVVDVLIGRSRRSLTPQVGGRAPALGRRTDVEDDHFDLSPGPVSLCLFAQPGFERSRVGVRRLPRRRPNGPCDPVHDVDPVN